MEAGGEVRVPGGLLRGNGCQIRIRLEAEWAPESFWTRRKI
jgi:hypothetical protein